MPDTPPTPTAQAKSWWNARGREDAHHWMLTKWSVKPEEFYQSGEAHLSEFFMPFLAAHGFGDVSRLTALDLGCGAGRVTRAMCARFGAVVGTDISEEMIAVAKREVTDPRVEFVATGGDDLRGVPDDSIDVCFSFLTLQHAPSQGAVRRTLADLRRVLKPGGLARIQLRGTPGGAPGKVVWFRAFDRGYIALGLLKGIIPVPWAATYTPLLGACFTADDARRLAQGLGYGRVVVRRDPRVTQWLWLELQR